MPQISEEKLKRIKKIESTINKNLFIICVVITLIAMLMTVIGFFNRGIFPPSGISIFYIGVLFVYSVHKEMLRWLGEKETERQGEWFLYIWIGLTLILYIINFFTKNYFSYSPEGLPIESLKETSIITLEVSVTFVFTRLSKVIRIIIEKR